LTDILAADIGGTNSRFAHFAVVESAPGGSALRLLGSEWLGTGECESFPDLMGKLRSGAFPLKPEMAEIAVLAVAGPVEGGSYSAPPLIKWDIDVSNAKADFGFRECVLINDFVAQAYAARSRAGEEAELILPGRARPDGTVAVLGAGTGLGKAALVPDSSGGYLALPSEGGHASFPFVSEEEVEYQRFLLRELDEELTCNVVVSGRGLSLLHRFLTCEDLGPQEVASGFAPGSGTLHWASRFLGRVCRNFALEVLATGGVYMAGGVAARNPVLLRHGEFGREFRSSGKHAGLLGGIPVYLITDENSGLWGAAYLGLQTLRKRARLDSHPE
jgi:glucokinase